MRLDSHERPGSDQGVWFGFHHYFCAPRRDPGLSLFIHAGAAGANLAAKVRRKASGFIAARPKAIDLAIEQPVPKRWGQNPEPALSFMRGLVAIKGRLDLSKIHCSLPRPRPLAFHQAAWDPSRCGKDRSLRLGGLDGAPGRSTFL